VKTTLSIAAVLLLCSFASAQTIQDAPTPQAAPTPPAFWGVTGAYTAAILADNFTTQAGLKRGCHEAESPMLYGRHPSEPRFLAISFGIEAGEVFAARKMVRAHSGKWSRRWNAIGYALIAGEAAGRAGAAAHNEEANCR
jgi:hypothetical protein